MVIFFTLYSIGAAKAGKILDKILFWFQSPLIERGARMRRFLPLVACLLSVAGHLFADVTGSILGVVRDATSAVIPNVQITATNVDTNLRRTALSDSSGQYQILVLPTGKYTIEASAPGFQKFVATGLVVTVNEQRRVDVTLQVGAIEQQVEVSAAALQVETTNTQLGEVVEHRKLISLPLNGRSFIDLLGLQAGVAPTTAGSMQQDRPVSGGLSAGNIAVNGQRETANAFLVNGGDVSEGRNLGAAVIPNLDAIAEFRLITNSFEAEYGRFSGAIMNAVTKSGTNGFHGTVFEFLRNDRLDSRNFFDPEKGVLRRNQFGYAVGGPAFSGLPTIREPARHAASAPDWSSCRPKRSVRGDSIRARSSIRTAIPLWLMATIGQMCSPPGSATP
jgi:hypothetical protein